jgi:hypothetical protein
MLTATCTACVVAASFSFPPFFSASTGETTNPTSSSSSSSSSSLVQLFSIEQRPTHPLIATPNRFQLAEIQTTAAAASTKNFRTGKQPNINHIKMPSIFTSRKYKSSIYRNSPSTTTTTTTTADPHKQRFYDPFLLHHT